MFPAFLQKRTGGKSGQCIMGGYEVEMFLVFPKRGFRAFLIANVMEGDHRGHMRTIGVPNRARVDRYPSALAAGDDHVSARMAAQSSEDRGLSD